MNHSSVFSDVVPNHLLSSMIRVAAGIVLLRNQILGEALWLVFFFFSFSRIKLPFPINKEHKFKPPENIFAFLVWVFSETSSNTRWNNTPQSGHHVPP